MEVPVTNTFTSMEMEELTGNQHLNRMKYFVGEWMEYLNKKENNIFKSLFVA